MRLASGEITEAEFNSIISKLGEKEETFFEGLGRYLGYIVIIAIGMWFFGDTEVTEKLEFINPKQFKDKFTVDISNPSTRSGDVLAYVLTKEGDPICPHVFEMHKGIVKNLTMHCDSLVIGAKYRMSLHWVTPETNKGLLQLAKRININ